MKEYFTKLISHSLSTYPCEQILISPGVTLIIPPGLDSAFTQVNVVFVLWSCQDHGAFFKISISYSSSKGVVSFFRCTASMHNKII